MGLLQITPPACEAVSLAQVKLFLRVDSLDEDVIIPTMIASARQYAEHYTQRQFVPAAFTYTTGELIRQQNFILLPKPPLIAVASVQYVDSTGATNTADPSTYYVEADHEPAKIVFTTVPDYDNTRDNSLIVNFSAGYAGVAASIPAGVDGSSTGVTLNAGAGASLPAGNFIGVVDSEHVLVNNRSGDAINCSRGYDSTVSAVHGDGAAIIFPAVNVPGLLAIAIMAHVDMSYENRGGWTTESVDRILDTYRYYHVGK